MTTYKTLREAATLTRSLQGVLDHWDVTTQVTVNQFTPDVAGKLATARQKMDERMDLRLRAIDALTTLRKLIGQANHKHGVNDKLADLNGLKLQLTETNRKMLLAERTEVEEIEQRFTFRNRGATATALGTPNTDSVTTGLVTEDELEKFQSDARKLEVQITALTDSLAATNALSKLEVPPQVLEVLEALELI